MRIEVDYLWDGDGGNFGVWNGGNSLVYWCFCVFLKVVVGFWLRNIC